MNSEQNKTVNQTEDEILDSLASAFIQIAIQEIDTSDNKSKDEK